MAGKVKPGRGRKAGPCGCGGGARVTLNEIIGYLERSRIIEVPANGGPAFLAGYRGQVIERAGMMARAFKGHRCEFCQAEIDRRAIDATVDPDEVSP